MSEVRRLEDIGFDTVAISEHVTNGWQLAPLVAMAFAVAVTSRLRVLSLVVQNDLRHPAMLAKDIATIDALSNGRVELGLGAGWHAGDYSALGLDLEPGPTRIARLEESLKVIRQYLSTDTVNFEGAYYRINNLEALPQCVQRPNPPILVGAGHPRMLELAGRTADIVGIHAGMGRRNGIDRSTANDLTAASIEAKIARVRTAAAAAGRPTPQLQFSCYYVRVTDAAGGSGLRSTWDTHIEAEMDTLKDSPAVLVGTAAECAEKLLDWRERFGITYWHLGPDVDAARQIMELLQSERLQTV